MKSNATASAIRVTSRGVTSPLGMLDHQAAQYVGDVLAAVGHLLHRLVDPTPGDDLYRIVRPVEQVRRPLSEQAVRLVLEPVDLDDALLDFPHGAAVA